MRQPHSSQLIDLTQLHTGPPQPNVVSIGLQLSSGEQQQQTLFPQSSLSIISENLTSLIKQEIVEMDHYVQAQGEQLRRTLVEKRQGHYRKLLGVAEESAAKTLREKEEEVEKAVRRNAKLEARATQLTAEAQAWQVRIRTQEAAAATLQTQLRIAMTTVGECASTRQETEQCGALGRAVGEAEDAESAFVDPDRVVVSTGPSCKGCGKRVASVVLLPCRHLCLCTDCDGVAKVCPLCLSIRSSSIDVFLC